RPDMQSPLQETGACKGDSVLPHGSAVRTWSCGIFPLYSSPVLFRMPCGWYGIERQSSPFRTPALWWIEAVGFRSRSLTEIALCPSGNI
ncbi:MAG: hypothetical protein RBT75_20680, partial [Anaerolineae bacterium]|nr:hypothetical protein [Anaerolineae bacterium]